MDPYVMRLFASEVAMQCKFVLLSADDFDAENARYEALDERANEAHREASELRDSGAAHIEEYMEARRRAMDLMPDTMAHITRQWLTLQGIVVSAANLSKLLWGTRGREGKPGRFEAERQPLRDALEVDDSSVLYDYDLRNDFEHFDERLRERFSDPKNQMSLARNIGTMRFGEAGDTSVVEDALAKQFGHYDPRTGVLTFWAHSISVPAVVTEAGRILPLANTASRTFVGGE